MSDKFFIDSNILVYAHDTENPEKQQQAQTVIFDGIRLENAVISTQVLSEFYVTITQKIKNPLTVLKAKEEIKYLSILEIVEIDIAMILQAIHLQDKWNISYWDGLILAAAEQARCKTIISEDFTDQQIYDHILVKNPFK